MFLSKRIKSFSYAFSGLKCLWREVNFRIHIVAFIFVLIVSFGFDISKIEWLFVILSSFLVFFAEGLNTSIEKLLDFIEPDYNSKVKVIKDISAGFVLLAAINAIVVGSIIFFPKICSLF